MSRLNVDFLVTLKSGILILNDACVQKCVEGLNRIDASHAAFIAVIGQPKSGKTALSNLGKIFLEYPNEQYLDHSDWMEWASSYGIPKYDTDGDQLKGIDTIGILIATKPTPRLINGRRVGIFFIDIWALTPTRVEYSTLVDFCLTLCSATVFSELPTLEKHDLWSRRSSRISQLLDYNSLKRLHVILHYNPDEVHNRARFCDLEKAQDLCDELESGQFYNCAFLAKFHIQSTFFFVPIPAPEEEWNFNIKHKTVYFESLKAFFRNLFSEKNLSTYFPLRPLDCFVPFLRSKADCINGLTHLSQLAVKAAECDEDIKSILGGPLLGTTDDYETFMMTDRFKFIAAAAFSLYEPEYKQLEASWRQHTHMEPEQLEQEYENFLNNIVEDSRIKYGEEIAKAVKYIAPTMFQTSYDSYVEENRHNLEILERYNCIIAAKFKQIETEFQDSFENGNLAEFREELPAMYGVKENLDSDMGNLKIEEDSPWQKYISELYEQHMRCIEWGIDTLLRYEDLLEEEVRRIVLNPDSPLTVGEPKVPETTELFLLPSVKSLIQECLFELYGAMIHKQNELSRQVRQSIDEHEHAIREQLSRDVKVYPAAVHADEMQSTIYARNTVPHGGRETEIFDPKLLKEQLVEIQIQRGASNKELSGKNVAAPTMLVQREGQSVGIHIGASAVRVGLYGSTTEVLKCCFSEPPYIEFPSETRVSTEDVSKLMEDRQVKAIHVHDCLVNLQDPPLFQVDGEHALSWEEMLALFFTRLRQKAETECQASPITSCVVALDAYTPLYAKFRLKLALALAGFKQSFLVQTTTAIMATFSLEDELPEDRSASLLIVYQSKDAFDITLCLVCGGKMSVQTTNGLPLIKQQDTLWEKLLGFHKISTLVDRVLSQVLLDAGVQKEKLDMILLVTEQECFQDISALDLLQNWANGLRVIAKGPKDGILPGLIYFSANPPFTSSPLSEKYDQLFPTTVILANGKKHTLIRRNEPMPIGGVVYDLPSKFWKHSKKLTLSEQIGDETHLVGEFVVENKHFQEQFIRVTIDRDGLVTLAAPSETQGPFKQLSVKPTYYMPPEKYEEVCENMYPEMSEGTQPRATADTKKPHGQYERHVVVAQVESRVTGASD